VARRRVGVGPGVKIEFQRLSKKAAMVLGVAGYWVASVSLRCCLSRKTLWILCATVGVDMRYEKVGMQRVMMSCRRCDS
jgi:hypothetical protein